MDDATFNAKYDLAVDTFREWVGDDLDFSSSTILDFGCEYGVMALAMALKFKPKRVIGVDINSLHRQLLDIAGSRVPVDVLPENLEFHQVAPDEKLSKRFRVDCVFTWSTFEHVSQTCLDEVVSSLHDTLRPNGLVFLQIAPLYYSALGSHFDTLVDEPWVHLTRQSNLLHHAVMTAPRNGHYQQEDDENFNRIKEGIWSCYYTLNRITADEVVELFENHGFKTVRQRRTKCGLKPPGHLARTYMEEILETEQIVALFEKTEK